MRAQLQFLARRLMVGLCAVVLFCTSGRHALPDASSVRTTVKVDKAERSGIYHEVKQGQTLWGLARAYRVDIQTLARVNKLSDTTALYTGQKLYVPGATQQRDIASRCPCGTETAKPSIRPKPL